MASRGEKRPEHGAARGRSPALKIFEGKTALKPGVTQPWEPNNSSCCSLLRDIELSVVSACRAAGSAAEPSSQRRTVSG